MSDLAHAIQMLGLFALLAVMVPYGYRIIRWFFLLAAIRAIARVFNPTTTPKTTGNGTQAPGEDRPPQGASPAAQDTATSAGAGES